MSRAAESAAASGKSSRHSKSSSSSRSEEQTQQQQAFDETPSQTQPESPSRKENKQSHSHRSDHEFTPTIVTNFFNNYYRSMDPSEDARFKQEFTTSSKNHKNDVKVSNVIFKNWSDKVRSKDNVNVIDLRTYRGLNDFKSIYNSCLEESGKNEDVRMEKIISLTFDLKLHSCLDYADKYKLNDDKQIFKNFVIPQLGFKPQSDVSIRQCIEAINSFFENDEKIKTKVYNSEFPHSVHDKSKEEKGVNVVYLQHISRRYHDAVLKMVIQSDMSNEKIIESLQRKFQNDYDFKELSEAKKDAVKNIPAEKQSIKAQFLHPEITKNILNNTTDDKWIDNLLAVRFEDDDEDEQVVIPDPSKRRLSQFEKIAVRRLVSELRIVMSFIKIIRGGKEAKPETNLKQCLKSYDKILKETREFYENHKPQDDTIESFLRYFVDSVRFLIPRFNYKKVGTKSPLKSFINDLKGSVQFRFNKKLRVEIEKLLESDRVTDSDIRKVIETCNDDLQYINSPKTYDINELNIYSKIGKYCGLGISKDYRIAVGVAIVSWIQEKINLIRAFNSKKRDVVIYIKA